MVLYVCSSERLKDAERQYPLYKQGQISFFRDTRSASRKVTQLMSSKSSMDRVTRAQQLGGRDATLATIQEIMRVAGTTYDEVRKFGRHEQSFSGATSTCGAKA